MYLCPVCGYDNLPFIPHDYNICPCCGTEFGSDDLDFSHDELRQRWLLAGAPWFSGWTHPPANWNWCIQLFKSGFMPVLVTGSESSDIQPDDIGGPGVISVNLTPNLAYEVRASAE